MTTCSYISVLVIRQDIYSLHCKQCGLYETSYLSPTQAGSLPVTIETRASFLSSTIYSGWFPTCYHRNKSIIPILFPHLLPQKQDISSTYGGCSPPVTEENCYSLLRLFLTFYSNRNKGKVGNTLVIPRTQEYIVHLKHGNHVWDYIPGVARLL